MCTAVSLPLFSRLLSSCSSDISFLVLPIRTHVQLLSVYRTLSAARRRPSPRPCVDDSAAPFSLSAASLFVGTNLWLPRNVPRASRASACRPDVSHVFSVPSCISCRLRLVSSVVKTRRQFVCFVYRTLCQMENVRLGPIAICFCLQ